MRTLNTHFCISGDLLENYCWTDDLMNAARIFFSVTILLTYPIECFVTREVLEKTIFTNDYYTDLESTEKRHVLLTCLLVVTTYFISMSTDCLGVVLELNVSCIKDGKLNSTQWMDW